MLAQLDDFRSILEDVIIKSLRNRIVIVGNGYSGRFVKWYAKYYHNVEVDYVVSLDMKTSQSYESEIYRMSLFDFGYKDVENAVVWLTIDIKEEKEKLYKKGWVEEKTLFDIPMLFYQKTGIKIQGNSDIQFMKYLEIRYKCDLVSAVEKSEFTVAMEHGHAYRCTTQKEIFGILDACHALPRKGDAIFDYGCGKGAAILSFLDYGFYRVGGVEYEPQIYDALVDNFKKLGLVSSDIELIHGDASEIDTTLDKYNWIYFFQPFDEQIMKKCVNNIIKSYARKKREIKIISISPSTHAVFEEQAQIRLIMQLSIEMRQRCVDIYEIR